MRCPRCEGPVTCGCTANQLDGWARGHGITGVGVRALERVRDMLLARWTARGLRVETAEQRSLFGLRKGNA